MFLFKKYKQNKEFYELFEDDQKLSETYQKFKRMADDVSIPHIIFYGPKSAEKRDAVSLYLEMLFGEEVHNITDTKYRVSSSGNKTEDVMIKQSNYHIVINPTGTNYDRYLIRDVVQVYINRKSLGMYMTNAPFKVILINNADNLSYYGQTILRTILETYTGECRFIMWCNKLSKIIDPLRSRCYCFKLNIPDESIIRKWIFYISCKEKISLTYDEFNEIIRKSDNSTTEAIWQLDLYSYNTAEQLIYDKNIDDIVQIILTCDMKNVSKFRDKTYPITVTNITCGQIVKDVLENMLNNNTIDDIDKLHIISIMESIEYNITRKRHDMIHLETFAVDIMNLLYYKTKGNI